MISKTIGCRGLAYFQTNPSDLPTNTLEKPSIKWISTNVYQDVQILHSKILGETMKL